MKKVLLLTLSLALGFSAFAQQRVMQNDAIKATASAKKAVMGKEMPAETATNFAPISAKSCVMNRWEDMEYASTIMTFYDLQSNQYVANRMYQMEDGAVAVTATMSHQANATASDRGTGYNFYKAGQWLYEDLEEMPRVEPFKTGWPSIAQWGEGGEILLSHGGGNGIPSGMQCFTRETAGDGEWIHMGTLPPYPDGYAYPTEYPTWPRVVTCGDNHNIIIAVAVLQHSISEDETDLQTVMWRSEDAENWEVSYGPLHDLETPWDHNQFSADDYCMAANGNKVALLYSGCLTNSTWLFTSNDCGLTWESTRVWENPYEGREFTFENGEPWGMEDTLFMPMNGSIVIDNNGITHVALNTFEMIHTTENESGYYSYWAGRPVDGILYWNSTQEAPIQDTYHPEYAGIPHLYEPNPHHAARLWWPIPNEPGYVHLVNDSIKWIGFIPMYEGEEWSNDMYYMSGSEYVGKFYGASGHPALSCDPEGNLACAFSSPCEIAVSETGTNANHYLRHIYVSYRNVDEGYWRQIEDDISDPEEIFELSDHENVFTMSVPNTVNPGEFWFGFQADMEIGFKWGSNATQSEYTDNEIFVVKVNADPTFVSVPENHDAINPMTTTRVYPNPVVDQMTIEVNASQASEMSISVYNLMGQKVMDKNVSINTGINTPTLNTSSLSSGVYFVTVKANGFENTMKFVVK